MRLQSILAVVRRSGAVLAFVALLALSPPHAWAGQHELSPAQSDAVRQIIREYLINNPEVILEAIEALKRREEAGAEAKVQRALRERRDELFNDPDSPVGGNPQGDVTLVEFFDYRCPYCKRVHPDLQALMQEDRNLRFIYKEWPILGAESVFAARAALAARAQGKYHAFHAALMEVRGTLTEAIVLGAAKTAVLDVDQLKRDIAAQKEKTEASFARTSDLAAALEIRGTPAFVIGDLVIRGAIGMEDLKKVIADVRSRRAR
jgi:protein-disulfide isomerase